MSKETVTVSFIIPCRNKEKYVGATVDSVLAQTYAPMEIILSDQASEDGSLRILHEKRLAYSGRNKVYVLQCPHTTNRGMAGLNDHLNWLHQQITGDLVIMCAADDINHPERAKHTVAAFQKYRPSYIGTGVHWTHAEKGSLGQTDFPDRRSRFIGAEEMFAHQIGSSGSSAWARDLYEKHGPLHGIESQDMILPPMALMERGVYFVDKVLHTYIGRDDADNTGMEGQIRAFPEGSDEQVRAIEINNWHNTSNWSAVARRFEMNGFFQKMPLAAQQAFFNRLLTNAQHWAMARDHMTVNRITPANMRI